jgi:hypothetical protein
MLRDYDEAWGKDLSINRCTLQTKPFLPFVLQLGNPTPADFNDCTGTDFSIERSINEITPSLIQIPVNENIQPCTSEIEPQVYESVITGIVIFLRFK